MPRDLKVADIPVFLAGERDKPIGKAVVDTDGDIILIASGDMLIRDLPRLAELGQILSLRLHVEYKPAEQKEP